MTLARIKRKLLAGPRRLREARMFAKAMRSAEHPILAHIIPTRRCNLSCGYCNEYDNFSKPVPTEEMLRRIDRLAALGTTIITISGGEPLLHPDLDLLIRRIRDRRIIPTLITNATCSLSRESRDSIVPDCITCRSVSITSIPTKSRRRV
jgi:MoaA/NifB/PqqE/SkfB family radical SAM enzyme